MILGPISLIDCLVFLVFLAPQLLIEVGLIESLQCALQALPFLTTRMPYQLLRERYFTSREQRSPFVQHASLFQDLVIRCVRYAFAFIPAKIGRVFFSKPVSLPFTRWRMLRHGYLYPPLHYEEVNGKGMRGIWIVEDPDAEPDIMLYYLHGGGFSMGSAYFYLEFLMGWCSLLKKRQGFRNPAVFALEYTLVPEAVYPKQLEETMAGYDFVLGKTKGQDPDKVVVAGDSAGATLILSLLLQLTQNGQEHRKPGFATIISPWCQLVSDQNKNTPSDYLNAEALHLYARQYIGDTEAFVHAKLRKPEQDGASVTDFVASPGRCDDIGMWKRAKPHYGFHVVFGAEEVFAPNTRRLIKLLRSAGVSIAATDKERQVHAWPVVSLFLKDSLDDRLEGLYDMVDTIAERMSHSTKT